MPEAADSCNYKCGYLNFYLSPAAAGVELAPYGYRLLRRHRAIPSVFLDK
jgi:hypothetical protein